MQNFSCSFCKRLRFFKSALLFLLLIHVSTISAQDCGHTFKNTIVLTKENPNAKGKDSFFAPGSGFQCYTVYNLDCSSFNEGGKIFIKIRTGKDSCSGSFDLFPQGIALPSKGKPTGTLAGDYDVTSNAKGDIEYKFDSPQIFQFGATGNWFSRKGQKNTYTFEINVDYDFDHEHLGTIVLTPSSPKGSGLGTLIAPGRNRQAYKLFTIDASSFAVGDKLVIKVKLKGDGCSASFDLFPAGIKVPRKGRPTGTLLGAYGKGVGAKLEYKLSATKVFQFGATGDWGARKGSTHDFEFTAEVITDEKKIN